MGSAVSSICNPCFGASPPKPKALQTCNIQGYDWEPAQPAETPKIIPEVPAKAVLDQPNSSPNASTGEPEEEQEPPPTTPITLEVMQGLWVTSPGAKVSISGTEVTLNGMPMKAHPVKVDEEGLVTSIGSIWQLKGWKVVDKIEFKEAPNREVMEYARSVEFTRVTDDNDAMKKWEGQMAGLGYAGSVKDVKNRGVEGCCPGTCDAKAKIAVDDENRDKAELEMLNNLISEWRVPGLFNIPSRSVIPDFSNRGHTGLSVEHVHYLATSFKEKGFQTRQGDHGHDIPVLVKQPVDSELGQKSIENWRSKVKDEPGFPPLEHYERLFKHEEVYASLGNGHFNQALNLFQCECKSIYTDENYTFGNDKNLKEAVYKGVSALVLRPEIPLRDREIISRLLNSKREFKWSVKADGSLSILDAKEDTSTCKQFEAMSKVLDAVELNCLVRSELGVKDSHRIGQ